MSISERSAAVDQVTLRRRATGLTAHDPARSAGGYTLFAPQTGNGAVYLVDIEGRVVHRWQMPVRPGRDAVILPNGNLGYNGSHPDPFRPYPIWPLWRGGDFYEATPDGAIVWRHEDPRHHHDAQWLADGDLLYATVEPLSPTFATRIPGGAVRPGAEGSIVHGDVIRRVNRRGETVWRWAAADHLDPEAYPIQPIFDRQHWPFVNGVGETRDGLVLMSLRVTSGIIAVAPDTGRVVWRIGADLVAQQHAPIEMADGSILCFDNGNLRPGLNTPFSRAVQIDPHAGRVVWTYADALKPAFFSPYMGSAERLWNGNTFICESAFGRLFEVTPEGDVVWEYVIPFFAAYPDDGAREHAPGLHNSAFRAHRYHADRIPWLKV